MKTLQDITLYDLMGNEYEIHIKKNEGFGFNLEVECEEDEMHVQELALHKCAAEGFAEFCRRYLASYEKVAA